MSIMDNKVVEEKVKVEEKPKEVKLTEIPITDEVVVHKGQIAIRPMMMLSMTFDHRLIDGSVAGRFRNELRALLENPATMLASLR